jgi:hypothetical protein
MKQVLTYYLLQCVLMHLVVKRQYCNKTVNIHTCQLLRLFRQQCSGVGNANFRSDNNGITLEFRTFFPKKTYLCVFSQKKPHRRNRIEIGSIIPSNSLVLGTRCNSHWAVSVRKGVLQTRLRDQSTSIVPFGVAF